MYRMLPNGLNDNLSLHLHLMSQGNSGRWTYTQEEIDYLVKKLGIPRGVYSISAQTLYAVYIYQCGGVAASW
jgi:hypothetical protein